MQVQAPQDQIPAGQLLVTRSGWDKTLYKIEDISTALVGLNSAIIKTRLAKRTSLSKTHWPNVPRITSA